MSDSLFQSVDFESCFNTSHIFFSARIAVVYIAVLIMWAFKLWFGKRYTSEVFVQIRGLITGPVFFFFKNGNLERSVCAWDGAGPGLVCVCARSSPSSFPFPSPQQGTDHVVRTVSWATGYILARLQDHNLWAKTSFSDAKKEHICTNICIQSRKQK